MGAPRDMTVATSSLEALELCEAAYLSGRHHTQIALPLSASSPILTDSPSDWVAGLPYSGQGGGRDGRQFG